MNWYKKAQNVVNRDNDWTPEERSQLEVFSEAVAELERKDTNSVVHVFENVIGRYSLSFGIQSAYVVDTQVEPMWDKFTNSLYIEKIGPDYFEVEVNEGGFKPYTNFKDVMDIVQSFPL